MIKNNKGYTLVLVIIVFAVLAIVGTTFLSVALFEKNQVTRQDKNRQAYYAARSGADAMASYIVGNPDKVPGLITNTATTPGAGNIGSNSFKVKVSNSAAGLLISATGIVNGTSDAHVNLTMKQVPNPAFKYAIFSDQSFSIGNNTVVTGDIGTNASSISFGGEKVVGSVTLGPGATPAQIAAADANATGTATKMATPVILPDTDPSLFTVAYNATADKTLHDGDIKYRISSASDLGFLADITGDASILTGGGKAEIHIFLTAAEPTLSRDLNPPNGVTIYLYYNGTGTLNSNNGGFYYKNLFIYAPNATFEIKGGGNGTYLGKMIVNQVTFPNSNSSIFDLINIDTEHVAGGQLYARDMWSN